MSRRARAVGVSALAGPPARPRILARMSAVVAWVLIAAAGLVAVSALAALAWQLIVLFRHYRSEESSEA